jgi:hypothetical protein
MRTLAEGAPPADLTEKVERAAASALSRAAEELGSFFMTGRLSGPLQQLVGELLDIMVGAVEVIELHAEVGLGIAAGAMVAGGAKARVHGAVSGRVVIHHDVAPWLREQLKGHLIAAAELLDLLRGKLAGALTEVSLTPEELRSQPR